MSDFLVCDYYLTLSVTEIMAEKRFVFDVTRFNGSRDDDSRLRYLQMKETLKKKKSFAVLRNEYVDIDVTNEVFTLTLLEFGDYLIQVLQSHSKAKKAREKPQTGYNTKTHTNKHLVLNSLLNLKMKTEEQLGNHTGIIINNACTTFGDE